ncbi:mitochondrial 54S ribosomal protein mL54 [Calcarisporiella thermophila]|uniref:mitochondrial 54S ribosomal protein mL54 n=1 Tax=Calcarisporiella thermophila TaxID=911321 RepID=UPI0037438F6E
MSSIYRLSRFPHRVRVSPLFVRYTQSTANPSSPDLHASEKLRPVSSCPQGTVLKGLNYHKEGSDPIAKADEEYPSWLWELLDEEKTKARSNDPTTRQFQRKTNREAIRSSNFMKNKKT